MALTASALIVTTFFAVEAVSRLLYAPWSIGVFGRDTLTGDWVGSLRAHQGAEYGLHLALEYHRREGSGYRSSALGFNNLKGRATLCTPAGVRYEYVVSGFATPWGVVEDLWLEYGDPKSSALSLRLSGAWQGRVLSLKSDANPFLPDGTFAPARALSGDDPDDSFAPFGLTKRAVEDIDACRFAPQPDTRATPPAR